MFRTIALILNWPALAVLVVGMGGLLRANFNLVGPETLIPLLPYATALATYHFQPKLPMVWASLALNVLLFVIGLFGVVAAVAGMAAQPFVAGVLALLVFVVPFGFNVRNMLRIKRGMNMPNNRLQATRETRAPEA